MKTIPLFMDPSPEPTRTTGPSWQNSSASGSEPRRRSQHGLGLGMLATSTGGAVRRPRIAASIAGPGLPDTVANPLVIAVDAVDGGVVGADRSAVGAVAVASASRGGKSDAESGNEEERKQGLHTVKAPCQAATELLRGQQLPRTESPSTLVFPEASGA